MLTASANTKAIAKFLDHVWADNGDGYMFVASRDPGQPGRWVQQCIRRVEDIDIFAHRDMYFCPTRFRKPYREKQYAQPSRWLHLDLDSGDYFDRHLTVPPTIIMLTSQGRSQMMWRLSKRYEIERVQHFNKQFAQASPDRSGWEINKYLRIPYTANYKRPTPEPIELHVWRKEELAYLLPNVVIEPAGTVHEDSIRIRKSPTDASAKQILARFRGSWKIYVNSPVKEGNRGRMLYAIARNMADQGATADEVETVLRSSRAFQSKVSDQGTRWGEQEIERLLRKTIQ